MSDEKTRDYKMTVHVSLAHIVYIFWAFMLSLSLFTPLSANNVYNFVVIELGFVTTCLLAMRWWAVGNKLDAALAFTAFLGTTSGFVRLVWFTSPIL